MCTFVWKMLINLIFVFRNLYHILLNVPEFTGTYIPAHTNVGGYFLGLIFGYIFYKYRETKLFTNNVRLCYVSIKENKANSVFFVVPNRDLVDDFAHGASRSHFRRNTDVRRQFRKVQIGGRFVRVVFEVAFCFWHRHKHFGNFKRDRM